ncbi:MAG: segregation/condensation protein A [Pirellulales bacterium]
MQFRVDLDIFRGPLDLLLYLVKKHELEIADVPIATITEQFLTYLEVLQEINIDDVGDFLDMASTLVEIKSRLVLPHGGEEADELLDPRSDLVQQLLEYKKFKDAASLLDDRSRDWQQHYPRLVDDLPPRQTPMADQPILEVELWDLVSAFGRIIRESQVVPTSNIVYDDTPIHVHMRRIHRMLAEQGRCAFSQLFAPGMHKSTLIGVFLSILELVRHHSVLTDQAEGHGEIWVLPGEKFDPSWNLADIDTSKADELADKLAEMNLPIKPR